MNAENRPRAYKFFTGARRIPLMVGRFATGEKIPFGPYRITQFVVSGVVLVVCKITNPLWSTGNILTDVATGAVFVLVFGFLSGKLPLTRRSALAMGRSFFQAVNAPAEGTLRGSSITIRKPHRAKAVKATHRRPLAGGQLIQIPVTVPVVVNDTALHAAPSPTRGVPAPQRPTSASPELSPPRATSALEALLAQAGSPQ